MVRPKDLVTWDVLQERCSTVVIFGGGGGGILGRILPGEVGDRAQQRRVAM